ncbi:MAG: DUF5916 domain-containing protein [Myxococcota bacterium]
MLLGLALAVAATSASAQRSLTAPLREGEVVIDGELDAAWDAASWQGDFVERRPSTGAVPAVPTRFKVLYDEGALYVFVEAFLEEDEVPRAAEMTRDSFRLFDDDAITIKLDVRHDRRTTLGFGVNPVGQQIDYIAIDNGNVFRRELDSVWEAATKIRRDAWTAEFRIPVPALGLRRARGPRTIGLNITRDHNRRRGTYDWAALPIEFGAFSALHYGELHGLEGMAGGRPLTLVPYVTAGWRENDESRPPRGSPYSVLAGGEARLRLGEDSWGEITVLTDFAQVDLDDPAVNLDRFPLFFAERRPFFLSGLSVFQFGAQQQAQPFFTRRIGLDDNRQEIAMLGGAKVYGHARLGGNTALSFGVLDVITGGGLYGDAPLTNDAVLRLRLNVGRASYVGVLGTLRNSDGGPNSSSAGADFSIRAVQERLQIDGFVAGTFTGVDGPDDASLGMASQLGLQWRGRVWRPSVSVLWVDEDFDPSVGFVRRRGVIRTVGTLRVQHRTRRYGLETVDLFARGFQEVEDDTGDNIGRSGGGEIALSWVAGMSLYARADYVEDVVRDSFQLAGRDVQAGRYQGARLLLGLQRSSARNPSFELEYDGQSGYFGGFRQTLRASAAVVMTRHLRLAASTSASYIDIPDHDPFEAVTASASLIVAPTITLQLDGAWQINTIAQNTVTLVRLRWRYVPGSDLFLVYREQRPYGDARDDPDQPLDRTVLLKLSYRYDTLL